ncbi:hypothetical protein ACWD6I_00965 [Streptomyces sp. NPDC002454]
MRATAVTARGSLFIVLISLPFLAVPNAFPPRVLPFLTLCLAAAHGSVLVYRRLHRS